ncbi:bone marrow proteoglycan-like isoform X2 [Rana temporaria]|uniref:bone marrow proteoglycan-like isoform X2 n=1 Tax=Rana temporaria TaxID=8407 RepID=UPI001AAC800B|nr:bone marrow proteoglycan-like isoform X2 [Rana temporaria]
MLHLLLLLLLGTAYAKEPDCFENEVDELVDPSSQENDNDMLEDPEEADDFLEDPEEADDLPEDPEEADDLPEDPEEADDLPEDPKEADLNEMSHNTLLECDSEATCHFKLYFRGKNFRKAQSVCKRQKGNLCSVQNSCVNNQLTAFARRNNQKLAWIGVIKPCLRRYRNVDGTKLNYTNFGFQQCKRKGRWCVALNVANGKWISVKCSKKLPYICRI